MSALWQWLKEVTSLLILVFIMVVKKCKCLTKSCECKTELFSKLETLLYSDKDMRTNISPTKETALLAERELTNKFLVAGEHVSALKQERESLPTTAMARVEPRHLVHHQYGHNYTNHVPHLTSYNKKNLKDDQQVVDGVIKLKTGAKVQDSFSLKVPNDISIVSMTSPSGLYAENMITIFLNEKDFSRIDKVRFIITLGYNSVTNMYKVSGKLLKRSAVMNRDEEDSGFTVSPRLCSPKEILLELKRMVVWAGINPMMVYRQFRKMSMQQCVMIYRSANGFVSTQNERHEELMKNLESKKDTDHYYDSGYPRVNSRDGRDFLNNSHLS